MGKNNVRAFFAENLRRIRLEKEVSYEALAECMGVSVSAVRQYEKGLKLPAIDKIFEAANLLQVSVASLIGENDFSTAPNVQKIVDDSVFEYRRQHAMEILKITKCKLVKNKDKLAVFAPVKILEQDEKGGVKLSTQTYDAEFSDVLSAVELIEEAELRAVVSSATFNEVLAKLIQVENKAKNTPKPPFFVSWE